MKTLTRSLKNSLFNLFSPTGATAEPPRRQRVEQLRVAMLDTLGKAGCEDHARLASKLQHEGDVLGLWYSRSELMAALADMHGETRARQEIAYLSERFRGLLPQAMLTEKHRGTH
jgi:hypothetical protein